MARSRRSTSAIRTGTSWSSRRRRRITTRASTRNASKRTRSSRRGRRATSRPLDDHEQDEHAIEHPRRAEQLRQTAPRDEHPVHGEHDPDDREEPTEREGHAVSPPQEEGPEEQCPERRDEEEDERVVAALVPRAPEHEEPLKEDLPDDHPDLEPEVVLDREMRLDDRGERGERLADE